ncbi:MAG: hypothetical protein HUU02_07095 [Bacteroidetes bacterium]|nr:hypothetical protein [Bacteroidota bacterium]
MKNAVVIAVGSFISMLFIVGAMFVMYSMDPQAFGAAPPAAIAADTTAAAVHDSVTAHLPEPVKKDSVVPAITAAAVKPAPGKPVAVRKPLQTIEFAEEADTTDWKSRAKLFEAMSVESASSILMTMNDKEVKQIIPHIKKRNAAKILALFDPDRAARIIR